MANPFQRQLNRAGVSPSLSLSRSDGGVHHEGNKGYGYRPSLTTTKQLGLDAWSLTSSPMPDKAKLDVIAKELMIRRDQETVISLIRASYSYFTLGLVNQVLFDYTQAQSAGQLRRLPAWALANLALVFTFANMNKAVPPLLEELDYILKDNRGVAEKVIFQAYLASSLAKARVPPILTEKIEELLASLEHCDPETNPFEEKVGALLSQLRYNAEPQVYISGFYVDFLIRGPLPVIVECDGDLYHFVGGKKENGSWGMSILRRRFLETKGYKIIQVIGSEFGKRSQEDQRSWLKKKLTSLLGKNRR